MKQIKDIGNFSSISSAQWFDDDGNPEGGVTQGTGILISWQRGPLGRGDERVSPNGAFVEDVIRAAIDRLEFYQSSKFACPENGEAINYLSHALVELLNRTRNRESAGVEGTHETH